jgi:hypothetical protein
MLPCGCPQGPLHPLPVRIWTNPLPLVADVLCGQPPSPSPETHPSPRKTGFESDYYKSGNLVVTVMENSYSRWSRVTYLGSTINAELAVKLWRIKARWKEGTAGNVIKGCQSGLKTMSTNNLSALWWCMGLNCGHYVRRNSYCRQQKSGCQDRLFVWCSKTKSVVKKSENGCCQHSG